MTKLIASCPRCGARYRVERERLRPEGLRVRCTSCRRVFRVRAPRPRPAANPLRPAADADTPSRELDRSRLVLLADSDPDACKRWEATLRSWGLEVVTAHDGVEAMLTLQRLLPRVVILDAALPKMFGFQICEIVKRNESLRSTWVVLVGAIYEQRRYRRPPSDLYGADAYVERPELPEGLLPLLRRFGLPLRPAAATSASVPVADAPAARAALAPDPGLQRTREAPPLSADRARAAAPPLAAAPGAAAPATAAAPETNRVAPPAASTAPSAPDADPALAEQRAAAERLARIVVSDIILYNEERFARAVREGNVLEALAEELEEGRALLRRRIDARVCDERDHVGDELLRVARARGMK